MATEHTSGTQSATLDTEHTLNGTTPETTDGVFQLVVDVNALVAGDIVEFRCKEKVLSAGTQRLVFAATLAGPQGTPVWMSPPLILLHGWDMTLLQTDGTGRSFPWSIRKA